MKKRVFLLIIFCLLLCGCSAEVNIDLDRSTIAEDVTIYAEASSEQEKMELNTSFRKYMPIYSEIVVADTEPDEKVKGVTYYDRTLKETDYGYEYNYKHEFSYNDYNRSTLLRRSFRSAYFEKDNSEKVIKFYTDNQGVLLMEEFPQLSNVTVNIKTDYLVLETNADSIKGNVYTWKFDRSNYRKNIYLKVSSTKKNSSGGKTPSNPGEKDPDNPDDPDDPDYPDDPDDPEKPDEPIEPGISKSTEIDPKAKERAKYSWIVIPLAILGFFIIIIFVNLVSKSKK